MIKAIGQKSRKRSSKKHRAHWVNDRLVCSCGSRKFTVFRERVARKVRTRKSHRRRRVGVCENGHKTRIGFPSTPRRK